MVFQKGNAFGKLGREGKGRKSRVEETKKIVEWLGESIKQDVLIDLANSVAYRKIKEISESDTLNNAEVKDFVMPITLKGMTEKSERSNKFDLSDEDLKQTIADKLASILK